MVDSLRGCLDRRAEPRKGFHVALTAFDFFVHDDAIEAFALVEEFLGQIKVGPRHEAHAVDDVLHPDFGIFNPFGNFDLLLAGQQGNLTHLLEIHADGIVEDIEPAVGLFVLLGFFFFLLFFARRLVGIDVALLDQFDFNLAETGDDFVDDVRIIDRGRQIFFEVVKGEVTLILAQLDQLAGFVRDELVDVHGRSRFDGRKVSTVLAAGLFRAAFGLGGCDFGNFGCLDRGGCGFGCRLRSWLFVRGFARFRRGFCGRGLFFRYGLGLFRYGLA